MARISVRRSLGISGNAWRISIGVWRLALRKMAKAWRRSGKLVMAMASAQLYRGSGISVSRMKAHRVIWLINGENANNGGAVKAAKWLAAKKTANGGVMAKMAWLAKAMAGVKCGVEIRRRLSALEMAAKRGENHTV
jgi:hypothetical protein